MKVRVMALLVVFLVAATSLPIGNAEAATTAVVPITGAAVAVTQEECATCFYEFDENDCIMVGELAPLEACSEVIERGEECYGLGDDPCYKCDEFREYSDSCDDIDDQDFEDYSIWPSPWYACDGMEHCPDAGIAEQLAEDALQLLRDGDFVALHALVAASDGRLGVNNERGALQMTGCGGAIVLHVVLDDSIIDGLTRKSPRPIPLGAASVSALALAGLAAIRLGQHTA
jgi:hypothetical protein